MRIVFALFIRIDKIVDRIEAKKNLAIMGAKLFTRGSLLFSLDGSFLRLENSHKNSFV